MIRAQNEKSVLMIHDLGVTNGETASGFVDTLDYDYCTIDIMATTSNNTTNNFTTLDLAEGLVSNAYTTITAFVGDTAFTIPDADTSDPVIVARFNVQCDKYERYLRVQAAVLTTQGITALARLGYKDEVDTTASNLGVGVLVTA